MGYKTIISQLYPNIEYIIVDGASTDNTFKVIQKYRDKITKIISEPDTGIYNAMNKGVTYSTGDILYFLNANDSLYDENVIADIVNHFKETKASVIFGDMSFLNEDGNLKELRSYALVDKLFFINENICHQGTFYRREVFDKCGIYDESFKLFADYDLNLKAIMVKGLKAKHINRTIANFTLEGPSNSSKYKEIQDEERHKILSRYFTPYQFMINKVLNKTFRTIARNQILRKIAGLILRF